MNVDKPRAKCRNAKRSWAAVLSCVVMTTAIAGCAGHSNQATDNTTPPAQVARNPNAPGNPSNNQKLIVHGSIMAPQKAPLSAGPQYQPH